MTAPSMSAELVRCRNCGRRNRVPAAASGIPRCGNCHQLLPWIAEADDTTFAEVAEAASIPVVVDLWAPWCGPCRMVEPVLSALAAERAGSLKVVKVNVDENPALASRYQAMSIPLLVIMRDGHEVDRVVGAVPKSQIEQRLATVESVGAG